MINCWSFTVSAPKQTRKRSRSRACMNTLTFAHFSKTMHQHTELARRLSFWLTMQLTSYSRVAWDWHGEQFFISEPDSFSKASCVKIIIPIEQQNSIWPWTSPWRWRSSWWDTRERHAVAPSPVHSRRLPRRRLGLDDVARALNVLPPTSSSCGHRRTRGTATARNTPPDYARSSAVHHTDQSLIVLYDSIRVTAFCNTKISNRQQLKWRHWKQAHNHLDIGA